MQKVRIVYYLNQFFGQEGGEEAASMGISIHDGAYGIAKSFQAAYGEEVESIATIVCGDNYIAERLEEVTTEIVALVKDFHPDAFVTGPAFAAGRYGVGCGALCTKIQKELKIPVITAMHEDNPGVALYHKGIYIVKAGNNARTAKKTVNSMASLLRKLIEKQPLGSPEEENYFARGYKRNVKAEKAPAKRTVDMLLDKYYGREFDTEVPLPVKEDVVRPAAIKDLSKATIAIATDGGLYPAGNPDRMPPINVGLHHIYEISNQDSLKKGEWVICHNGYDNTFANEDPNRMVPVDAMRHLEQTGHIGKLYDYYLATTGLVASVANATKIGKEMAQYVKKHDIDAVILTST